jgi:hypothetical protein
MFECADGLGGVDAPEGADHLWKLARPCGEELRQVGRESPRLDAAQICPAGDLFHEQVAATETRRVGLPEQQTGCAQTFCDRGDMKSGLETSALGWPD